MNNARSPVLLIEGCGKRDSLHTIDSLYSFLCRTHPRPSNPLIYICICTFNLLDSLSSSSSLLALPTPYIVTLYPTHVFILKGSDSLLGLTL